MPCSSRLSRSAPLLASALFLLHAPPAGMAHPGHPHGDSSHEPAGTRATASTATGHDRRWTDAAGSPLPSGTFVTAKDGRAQLRRADGTLAEVPLSQLDESDRLWIARRIAEIRRANEAGGRAAPLRSPGLGGNEIDRSAGNAFDARVRDEARSLFALLEGKPARTTDDDAPEAARAFAPFVALEAVRTRWDDRFLYVESNGIPAHRMMVGITAWQQQVPIPQRYVGENAWRIPLRPAPARNPRSTKGEFLRGAIAIAANGVPIFNPLNNRGDDAFLFGELDEFGGHCGRADDYHYHVAPVHLQKTVGRGRPIAYALDGYPILGYEEPDGSPVVGLDAFNGHADRQGRYHYHATKTYPYLNGGFHGEVVERDGQVDPQPRAEPLRPALPPLRDARIVDFRETKPGSFLLTYDVKGRTGTVGYVLGTDGSAAFSFTGPDGRTTSETYSAKRRPPAGSDRRAPPPPPRQGGTPPSRDEQPPSRDDGRAGARAEPDDASQPRDARSALAVTSASVDAQGSLSVDCTCDGAGRSPAVEWRHAPPGTKSFAVSLWHAAPDREKSYWVVYDIPADVARIESGSRRVGRLGLNDRGRAEYDPMCSRGPGAKRYHLTVYALSAAPKLSPDRATRENLLAAVRDVTLAATTLDFAYERKK